MGVVKCEKGHFYDDSKYQECPHCKGLRGEEQGIRKEQIKMMDVVLQSRTRQQDEKTIGIYKIDRQDPVVGWLVCTEGKEKGRDYRIHAGRNYIGRSVKQDIAFVDDERITYENHCAIVFEPRKGVFTLIKGEGDLLLVNNKRVEQSVELSEGDELELGESRLVFVPFCKGDRTWKKE